MIRSVCLHISVRSTQSETTKDEQVMIVRDKVRAEELARETPTQSSKSTPQRPYPTTEFN